MQQPYGRCRNCGERLYEHVDGGYQCLNCDRRWSTDEFDRVPRTVSHHTVR